MPLNLNVLPVNWQLPGVYVGIDASGAVQGTSGIRPRTLLIGLRRTTGTVAELVIKPITGPNQGDAYFGRGSQLAQMCRAFNLANPYAEVYAISQNEDAAGVKATATLTVVGTATAAGTLVFLWGGRTRKVAVAVGDDQTAVAAAIAAADTADLDSPTTSVSALGVVTVSARHKGAYGNSLSIVQNYFVGDETPAGITSITITAFASGATDPDVTAAVAVMGADTPYTSIVTGFVLDANMDVLETEMTSRWSPQRALNGHLFAGFRGTYGDTSTYGNARNSQFTSVIATAPSPSAPWVWAASLAAIEAAETDPARPRQNVKIPGVYAPLEADRFTMSERNLLLMDGMSTYSVQVGDAYLERLVTTYQTNSQGDDDPSYHDIETMRCLAFFRYGFASRIRRKYPQSKLGNDGEKFAPGQQVMTPRLMRGEALAFFDELNLLAIVEGRAQFAAQLVCERDAVNPNQMNVILPVDFVNQFRVTAALIAFKL